MKCPSCGAEIGNNRICPYCDTQINSEMLREKEILNKQGCPKCGSTNVTFNRENQGEIRGKNSKRVVHYTVGLCKDCGFTWRTDGGQTTGKRKTWLWVLGWIFIFPLPLTLILIKKKEMKPALKYGIIAAAWIFYLLIGLSGNASDSAAQNQTEKTTQTSSVLAEVTAENDEKTLNNELLTEETITDLMAEEESTIEVTVEETTSREYIQCTAVELFDMLGENALKAKSTYEGAFVEISGYISGIDASGKYISIGADPDNYEYMFDSIQCFIKDNATLEKVMDLSKDSYVTIKGKITSVGEVLGYSLNIESIN